MRVETERETDGRWIAEVPNIPGAMAYAPTRREAVSKVEALVRRVVPKSLREGMADIAAGRTVRLAGALHRPFSRPKSVLRRAKTNPNENSR